MTTQREREMAVISYFVLMLMPLLWQEDAFLSFSKIKIKYRKCYSLDLRKVWLLWGSCRIENAHRLVCGAEKLFKSELQTPNTFVPPAILCLPACWYQRSSVLQRCKMPLFCSSPAFYGAPQLIIKSLNSGLPRESTRDLKLKNHGESSHLCRKP